MEIDWDGNVLWEVTRPDYHHDARLTGNGNVLMLCIEEVAPDLAAKVCSGLPGTEHGGVMCSDGVVEMTKDAAGCRGGWKGRRECFGPPFVFEQGADSRGGS